jgi:hypothetical protein
MENKRRGPTWRVISWFCLGCLYTVLATGGIWRELSVAQPALDLWHKFADFLIWPALAIVCFGYYRRELAALKAAR